MDDKEILRLFNERDEKAISAASEKYGAYLSKIAENITYSSEDAEEVVNDGTLKGLGAYPSERPRTLIGVSGKACAKRGYSAPTRRPDGKTRRWSSAAGVGRAVGDSFRQHER